jgi:MFS family permease
VSAATRERNILIVTSASHFLTHMYMLVFPSLALTLRTAFDLPLEQVLTISFWMYLLYGVGALPAGILTDLTHPRRMLIVCTLGMGGCSLAAAQATTADGLRLALAGLGLCAAIHHPAGMALISRGIRRRGWALGFNGAWGNLGVVSAPFLAGVLSATLGWRETYLLLAVPGLAAGILAWVLPVSGEVEETGLAPSAQRTRHRRIGYFALLCLAMMLGGIAYRGQTLVLPAYFQERIGFLEALVEKLHWLPAVGTGTVAATALTSLAYLSGAWGQLVGGRLADRYDLRRLYLLFHTLSLPLLFLLGRLANVSLLVCAVGYAFLAFGMQPVENALVAALTPSRLRSTGYGLKFILTFGVGALAVHLVGHWQREGGLAAVFPWLALCVLCLVGCAALLWWVTRQEDLTSSGRRRSRAPETGAAVPAGKAVGHE